MLWSWQANSNRTHQSYHLASFRKVPDHEPRQRPHKIHSHLGPWLVSRTEAEVARRYSEIGAAVTVRECFWSELLWAIVLTKDNLWGFLGRESWPGFQVAVLAEHDLFRRIDHFFNGAMYYAARLRASRATEEALAAAAS